MFAIEYQVIARENPKDETPQHGIVDTSNRQVTALTNDCLYFSTVTFKAVSGYLYLGITVVLFVLMVQRLFNREEYRASNSV
jgi:hypothetical protein